MTNVTISMDEETARWARVEAAKAGKSLSRWVGDLLAERRGAEAVSLTRQQEGLKRFLASPPRDLGLHGKGPTKEETYADVLYRHEHSAVREGHVGAFEAENRERVGKSSDAKKSRRSQRSKPA